MMSETLHPFTSHAIAADRFNANPIGDVVSLRNAEKCTWLLQHSGGTTGKAKIQVLACDNVTPSNTVAIDFLYRRKTTGASDVFGTPARAVAATGIETVPAESTIIEIEIDASDLPDGYGFAALQLTETADDPVVAGVIGFLRGLKAGGLNQATALA